MILQKLKKRASNNDKKQLIEKMNIPVFHDDQHGTAIISGAALLNACDNFGYALITGDVLFSLVTYALEGADSDTLEAIRETIDLSESEPEKHAELIELWREERIKLGIILPQDL